LDLFVWNCGGALEFQSTAVLRLDRLTRLIDSFDRWFCAGPLGFGGDGFDFRTGLILQRRLAQTRCLDLALFRLGEDAICVMRDTSAISVSN
jgi:hypothetical protein